MKKAKVIKNDKQVKETGCCFRSCGGMPCVAVFSKEKGTSDVKQKIEKILK